MATDMAGPDTNHRSNVQTGLLPARPDPLMCRRAYLGTSRSPMEPLGSQYREKLASPSLPHRLQRPNLLGKIPSTLLKKGRVAAPALDLILTDLVHTDLNPAGAHLALQRLLAGRTTIPLGERLLQCCQR